MRSHYLTIVLIILILIGSFFIIKDKESFNKLTNNVSNVINNVSDNSNQLEKPVEEGLSLELNSPNNNSTVDTPTITVSGKTSPNAEVFINEKELTADQSGDFSVDYELFEGENDIFIAVNDDLGNYAEKSIIVYLETTE